MAAQQPELQQQNGHPFSYDNLLKQTSRSPVDALTGKMRCLECGRLFNECLSLAKHLRDRHEGRNGTASPTLSTCAERSVAAKTAPPVPAAIMGISLAQQAQQQPQQPQQQPRRGVHDLRGGFTLADVLTFKKQPSQAPAPANRARPLYGQAALHELRQLVRQQQAAQYLQQPAQVNPSFGKQREGQPKRKLSRLKRTLLREKADKAAAQAVSACEAANAALKAASDLLAATSTQLKEAETNLRAKQAKGSAATKLCTEVQVLRLAKDQAEQQLQLSIRRALDADAEKQTCLAESATLWNGAGGGAANGGTSASSATMLAARADSNLTQLVEQLQLHQQSQAAAGKHTSVAPVVHRIPGHLTCQGSSQQQATLVEQLLQQQQQRQQQQLEQSADWASTELTAQVASIAPELFAGSPGVGQGAGVVTSVPHSMQAGEVAGWMAQQQQQQVSNKDWELLMAAQQQQQLVEGWQASTADVLGGAAQAGHGDTSSRTTAAEKLLATCKEVLQLRLQQQQMEALHAVVAAAHHQQQQPPAAQPPSGSAAHFQAQAQYSSMDSQAE